MANKNFSDNVESHMRGGSGGAKLGAQGRRKDTGATPERTAKWAGVPGKTQPRSRANGV